MSTGTYSNTKDRPKSAAVIKREESFKGLSGLLQSPAMKNKIALALPKHMTPDRLIRIGLSAASRTPLFLECTPESVALSLIRAAEFGVETDGWDAHLVPFKNKNGTRECQLIVDYKGLCKLAYQSQLVVEIQSDVVREGDLFEWERGTESYLRHKPGDADPAGAMVYVWAMAKIKGGGNPFIVLNRRQVMQHKAASQAAGSDFSPWNKPETEPAMWMKTALRQLAKLLPRSATLQQALKHEEAIDSGAEMIIDGVFDTTDEPAEGTKSDELAGRMGAGNGASSPSSQADPVSEARAQLAAATTELEARPIYDRCCGPESTLSSEDQKRVRDLWEMWQAEHKTK